MIDRLTYAFFGAIFGALLGVLCWFLYGLAFSSQFPGMRLNPEVLPWVKVLAGLFAVIGLVLKDRVGSVVGDAFTLLFSVESGRDQGPHLSFWKSILWLGFIALIVWYVISKRAAVA